jgi:hypothetical protein
MQWQVSPRRRRDALIQLPLGVRAISVRTGASRAPEAFVPAPSVRCRVPRARWSLALPATLACAAAACAPDRLPTAPRAHGAQGVRTTAPARALAPATGDNAVLRWSAVAMTAIRAGRPAPTVTSRAIAIVHTAMYDAWAAYDAVAVGTSYRPAPRPPETERTAANKDRAVSYAAHRALVDLFPAQRAAFDAALAASGYDPADASRDASTPAGVGTAAADAVLAARRHDGANQLGDLNVGAYTDYTGYASVNTVDRLTDPGAWQPLRVGGGVQRFATPHWSRVTPFALAHGAEFRPAAPARYPSGEYVKQVEDILHVSAKLDDREKAVAEYWSDGPSSEQPPGHWCLLAAWVSRRDGHGIDEDAKLFFALGNAVLDAGIAAWDAKRAYDSARPITAIRFLKAGKPVRAWGGPGRGTVLMRGEEWQPYQLPAFVTPPFSEYVSGHSTFSAASATVLARFTGSDAFGASVTIPARSSQIDPDVPAKPVTLTWRTFTDAADEAGISRRYGGIHFEAGDLAGRTLGRRVGERVWAKAVTYFTGAATVQPLAAR